jgi:uncharacterized protein (DUF2147 family)
VNEGGFMKKFVLACLLNTLAVSSLLAGGSITGFWKQINEKSGVAESVIAIYEHQGKYYGRIIGTYDEKGYITDSIYKPVDRAPGVIGNPYYSGMDIIWGLENKGSKFVDGEIIDPEKGRIYGAELWNDNGKLIVRGKILFLGRNQTWLPFSESEFDNQFRKPDLKSFVPSIPKPK